MGQCARTVSHSTIRPLSLDMETRPFTTHAAVFPIYLPLADLGGGVRDARPPPGRPNSFDFMQFSGKFGVFTPPLEGSRPPLGKILDPPLPSTHLGAHKT